jgi:hypothetical protein
MSVAVVAAPDSAVAAAGWRAAAVVGMAVVAVGMAEAVPVAGMAAIAAAVSGPERLPAPWLEAR